MIPNALSVSDMLLARYQELARRDELIKALTERASKAEATLAAIRAWGQSNVRHVADPAHDRAKRHVLALLDAAPKETP